MANKKLKTGNPFGTYSYNDEHPFEDGYRFNGYKDYNGKKVEMWRSKRVQHRSKTLRSIRLRNDSPKFNRTMLPRGTFSRGDKHPYLANVLFWSYNKEQERWFTTEGFEKMVVMDAESRHARRCGAKTTGLSKVERKTMRQLYIASSRLQRCTGIRWHVDHTKPLSMGGKHHHENMQVVPASWNESKSNSHSCKWNAVV